MNNGDKIILDLCGGTGAWSAPYKKAGYDVRLITLPDNDVRLYTPPDNVYGILAAPPCTEFSLAKTTKARDLKKGMETVTACADIIWECRYKHKLSFWALENPRGFLRQFLGKPVFTFCQWEFGYFMNKPTDLWGYFNIPKKTCYTKPTGLMKKWPNGKWNSANWNKVGGSAGRAITPAGFAKAFFKANR